MAEYIKRTSAMTVCGRYSQHCFEQNDSHGQDIADRIFDDIVEIPTADVVPVVRCAKCRHYNTSGCADGFGWCEHFNRGEMDERYCSYGERRCR